MMKKFFFVAMMAIAFIACDQKGSGSGVVDPSKPSETKELTPEQSKEKLAGIAQRFITKFNTADQQAVVDLMEDIAEKYESYSWAGLDSVLVEAVTDNYAKLPRYMAEVAKGYRAPLNAPQKVILSLDNWGIIIEADDNTKSWKLVGKTEDGSSILRCVDKAGKKCEIKVWGEGENYIIEDDFGQSTFESIKVVCPAIVHVLFTHDGKQIARIKFNQSIKDNEYAKFGIEMEIANLLITTKEEIALNHANLAFTFAYSGENMLSVAVNLPKYKIEGKTAEETFGEWLNKNMQGFDNILSTVGEADLMVDIMGEAQLKANFENIGKAYDDYQTIARAEYGSDKESMEAFCKWINESQTNGLYYNSGVKQAEFRMQVVAHDYEYNPGETRTQYMPEAVLYFPQDGSTYAVESYFDSKPFTTLLESVEKLFTDYMRLFHIIGPDDEFHF